MLVQGAGRTLRTGLFWLVPALLLLLVMAGVKPLAQSADYHRFADARVVLGIENFLNVVTSLAFLVVSVPALLHGLSARVQPAWMVLFAGTAMVGFGSAFYHLAPADWTLTWDRLPMAVAFAGLVAVVTAEHLGEALGRRVLLPALFVSVGSVLYWQYSGDLRLYVWVQATALLVVPLALLLFPARYSHREYYMYAFVLYGLAKLAEFGDRALYDWTGEVLSGHSAKHLLAAAGIACLYVMLVKRAPPRGVA